MSSPKASERRSRTEEVSARRRRRNFDDRNQDYNLSIDEKKRDPNYAYRWVNGDPKRIARLESQDWDRVDDVDAGCETERHAEATKGNETKTVLMRKPKDWFNEDHQRKEDRRKDIMKVRIKGREGDDRAEPMTDGPEGLSAKDAYRPKAANNSIEFGNSNKV